MPLGTDLVKSIAEMLKGVNDSSYHDNEGPFWRSVRAWAESNGRHDEHIHISQAAVRLSRAIHFAKSIDTLINDAEDELIEIVGKIAIAQVISDNEKRVPFLYPRPKSNTAMIKGGSNVKKPAAFIDTFLEQEIRWIPNSGAHKSTFLETWFASFFREIRSGLSQAEFIDRLSNLTIINFNYDRLFNYFLMIAIKQYDGVTFEVAQTWVNLITTIHPYGKLADLPTFSGDSFTDGAHIGMLTESDIARSPLKIKTFNERLKSDQIELINEKTRIAENLVFLGYGFHRQNDLLLGISEYMGKRIWGTAKHISEDRRHFLSNQFGSSHQKHRDIPPGANKVRLEDLDCRTLIDRFGDDFFEQPDRLML